VKAGGGGEEVAAGAAAQGDAEADGAEHPPRERAEGEEELVRAAGGGVAGGKIAEGAPVAGELDAEVGELAVGDLGPSERAVVGTEGLAEGAGIAGILAGEVPLEQAVGGRLVEALVGEPRDGEGEKDQGGEEPAAEGWS